MRELQRADWAEPSFILEDYFAGRTQAFGMFVDRLGNVRREFSVDIQGEVRNGQLILTERFIFKDGERSERIWEITPLGRGRYEGRADDVVGKARGRIVGNRLRWSYDLDLAMGPRTWRVRFDDVMVLQSDQILLNRASVSKFGITIGEVIICFQKDAVAAERPKTTPRDAIRAVGRPAKTDEAEVAALSA